ncbi:sigma-70 domain-containing protein [Anaerocolumna sp. AGMB13020]|uniref:sigma-70 domain-containing protein n=1 Tax=Anaerocolumna sp. AGMB13020 TaxID=3081750 RepID=UPI0029544A73|nr:sigma-70 domain-containing protein [Anaerocolumna sp. AGMB13020]WOO34541.1 sigma-70 domain-containing protein [Anaerocolumna sp. AGMB13020]
MEDKNKFQDMLKDVLEVARVQGNELGMNEIKEFFGGMGLNESQYEHIFAYLAANHIKVKGYVNTKAFDEYKEAVEESEKAEEGSQEKEEASKEDDTQSLESVVKQTGEDSQYLKMYLEDISAVKRADEAEYGTLLMSIRGKKEEVKERFIEVNLHKVVELAKNYQNRGVTLEDLIQEGNIGLLCGVEALYSETVLESEISFLEGYIKNALEQAVYENTESSSFEKDIINKISHIKSASEELAEELGREGNLHELARYVKMSEEELIDIINMSADGVKLSMEHEDK